MQDVKGSTFPAKVVVGCDAMCQTVLKAVSQMTIQTVLHVFLVFH